MREWSCSLRVLSHPSHSWGCSWRLWNGFFGDNSRRPYPCPGCALLLILFTEQLTCDISPDKWVGLGGTESLSSVYPSSLRVQPSMGGCDFSWHRFQQGAWTEEDFMVAHPSFLLGTRWTIQKKTRKWYERSMTLGFQFWPFQDVDVGQS